MARGYGSRVIPGAHVSTSGGIHTAIDRAEAIGGESLQIFTQSPRTWRPTNHDPANFERFKERRAEAGIQGVVCHALYLVNLATPDEEIYEKSVTTLMNTVDVACAIEADGVVFHVGSHLGAGFEAGLEHVVPALERALERCSETTWLLIENSAGRRRDDRPLGGRARGPRGAPRPAPAARHLPRLLPPVGLGRRRDGPRGAGRLRGRGRGADRPRPAAGAARERRRRASRLEPRPPREPRRGRDRPTA